MADQTYQPAAAAKLIGINIQTLRRWVALHSVHLSEGANPPKGEVRVLTAYDIETLKVVKELRTKGLTVDEINATLGRVAITTEPLQITTRAEPSALTTPTPVVPSNLEARLEALVPVVDRLERAQQHSAIFFLAGVSVGVISAGVFFLVLLLIFRL